MGLRVSPAELTREWSLSSADIDFVNAKPTGSRLGLAAQLKFFVAHGYFATEAVEISEEAVSYLAAQLGVGKVDLEGYDFSRRSGRCHCAEILRYLGFRRMKRADRAVLADWIGAALCPTGMSVGVMLDEVFLRCRDCRIFAPSRKEKERLARSERQRFLESFLGGVADRLHPETVKLMEASLAAPDARAGFLYAFETSAARVALSRGDLDRRLILCLYGLGTNAGLKRVAAGCPDVSYEELLHVGRRFISRDALEAACGRVANATLAIRNAAVWGEAGTACASDSKKFGAWDGNLMTEWHVRYGGHRRRNAPLEFCIVMRAWDQTSGPGVSFPQAP